MRGEARRRPHSTEGEPRLLGARRDEEAGRDASSGSAAPTSVALTVLISALAGDGEGPT